MLNEKELRQVIAAAAKKDDDRNLVVVLRTDFFAIDKSMMKGTDIECISVLDRRNYANCLSQEDAVELQAHLKSAPANAVGYVSDGFKDLLASVMSKAKRHSTILIEFVENRLSITEIWAVTDFLRKQFPLITFVFTTTSNMVIHRSKNTNVLYIFDDEWYIYECSEVNPDCMKSPRQDSRNLAALFNHALSNLWFEKDKKRFEDIDTKNMLPSDLLIYESIKESLSK